MRRIFNFIIVILLTNFLIPYNGIKDIPIQESGRIKPLDTFARNQLLSFYGKSKLKHEDLSAINFLEVLILDVDSVAYKDIFNINNPEVVQTLGLDWENNYHKYNFIEIFSGINNEIDYFNSLKSKNEQDLTKKELEFSNIYSNTYYFIELNASLKHAYLLPEIEIHNKYIADQLGLDRGGMISFHYFYYNKEQVLNLISNILPEEKISTQEDIQNLNDEEKSAFELAFQLRSLEMSYHNYIQEYLKNNPVQILKIIPPDPYMKDASWFSPLEILAGKNGPPTDRQIKLLSSLEEYISNRINFNQERADSAIESYKETISVITTDISEKLLQREVWYNKTNMLTIANAFYILSFLLICISWIFKPSIIYNISLSSIIMGMLVHSYAIINRIIIMQRPPVSTLYESIVFVSFIAVLISVIIEFWKKNTSGLFVGSILGSVLLFIGYRYASEGDTLGVLVAVLNSNFWLATHVVTITIGYGVTVVASTLAHLYLIKTILDKDKKRLKIIYNSLLGVTLFALFFTLFGTILGGIWADQSWGRFWGWDPKENGALLIVLWLIMMLHLRITGLIKPAGFAIGMVFANIAVALAWFGVNLLSVGLHSYGFTDGVWVNLRNFIFFELLFAFCFIIYYLIKYRRRVS